MSTNSEIQKIKDLLKLSDYVTIKVPNFYNFNSISKTDKSPYIKFYNWLAKKNQHKGSINVSSVWLCEEDAEKLDNQVKKWIAKAYKLNQKRTSSEFAWHHLELSPAVFQKQDRESWIKPGLVYIHKDFFNPGETP